MRFTTRSWCLLGVLCTSSVLAAKKPQREFRVERLDEAGSVHVAVISVAPWEEYAKALQPKFEMTEKKALEEALAITRAEDDADIRRRAFSLGIALPTSGSTYERTTSLGADGSTTTTAERRESRGPGDVAQAEPKPDTGEELTKALDLIRKLEQVGAPKTSEPILRHLAATALFQEVQLLNRFVKDSAIAGDERAYAVRLKVTLLPYARRMPYDAYAAIGFFHDEKSDHDGARDGNPRILPLLVTDALEGASHLHARDQVRQFAIALAAMVEGTGVKAGGSSFKEELRRLLGTDFNSLQTLARATDNTLYVRLGAMQQVSSDYAMVPRTYDVTTLVLVKEGHVDVGPCRLTVQSKTDFADAGSGNWLGVRTKDDSLRELGEFIDQHEYDLDTSIGRDELRPPGSCAAKCEASPGVRSPEEALLDVLYEHALQGEWKEFREHVEDATLAQSLWLEMAAVAVSSQFSIASLELPRHRIDLPSVPTAAGSAVAEQRKNSRLRVVIPGVRGIDAEKSLAIASVPCGAGVNAVPARLIQINEGERALEMFFDPLSSICKDKPSQIREILLRVPPPDCVEACISSVDVAGNGTRTTCESDCMKDRDSWSRGRMRRDPDELLPFRIPAVTVVMQEDEPPEACQYVLNVPAASLLAVDGKGEVQIHVVVKKGTEPIELQVGAQVSNLAVKDPKIVSSPPGAVSLAGGTWTVTSTATLTLPLTGLVEGEVVTIAASRKGCPDGRQQSRYVKALPADKDE